MLHTDISTTMWYYVGQNAQATADELWRVVGNNLGNSGPQSTDQQRQESPQVVVPEERLDHALRHKVFTQRATTLTLHRICIATGF